MTVCSSCGARVPKGSRFCEQCGVSTAVSPALSPSPASPSRPDLQQGYSEIASPETLAALMISLEIAQRAKRDIIVGGIWFAVGFILSAQSFGAAVANNDGKYWVLIGPMFYGGYRIIRGISRYTQRMSLAKDILAKSNGPST